jgi:hypothetical protein
VGIAPITILADHDIEGYAVLLWGTLTSIGWLDLLPLKLATFDDVDLLISSSDREVWRFVQANQMILLTNNRNMREEDSLEQTIREENTPTSLPVLTIGNIWAHLRLGGGGRSREERVKASIDPG